jgi:hypothetical protein
MADFTDILAVPDHGAQDILVALEKSNPTGINQYTKGGHVTSEGGKLKVASFPKDEGGAKAAMEDVAGLVKTPTGGKYTASDKVTHYKGTPRVPERWVGKLTAAGAPSRGVTLYADGAVEVSY